jgi:hypothetical protein
VQSQINAHPLSAARVPVQLNLKEKLVKLKAVLPFASERKLAALLGSEKGDMNAVVQRILEDGNELADEEEAAGNYTIIDLSVDDVAQSQSDPTPAVEDLPLL